MRQRARWFKGIVKDLPHAHFSFFFMFPFRIGLTCVAFFGSFPFFVMSLIYPVPCFILFPAGTIYWIIGDFILPKASIKDKIIAIFISPIESWQMLEIATLKQGTIIPNCHACLSCIY